MNPSTTIVIFGITGDLAQKKILPALFDLYNTGRLADTRIVGFSRRAFSGTDGVSEIHDFVRSLLPETLPENSSGTEHVNNFLNLITYVQGDFDSLDSYKNLGVHLGDLDATHAGGCSNKLFYLSVPPTLYEMIATHLSASGLSVPCGGEDGFARVLVEKPFGRDLETARGLDELFGKLFKEEQIFRIDHYLAKDALNTMLDLRRQNQGLSEKWNNKNIEKVEINLFEKAVVGSRGAFYDGVGALRDVGQNHMLQMLALVAMDIPDSCTPEHIQTARAHVLEHLVPFSTNPSLRRGQYAGYLAEPGVTPDSTTETFFSMTVFVDTPTFSGVPFVLTAGKALSRNLTEIMVTFKDGTASVFDVPSANSLPAYQKILLDCIAGDQTVFTSTAEVMAEWKFITPIVLATEHDTPFVYEKGSDAKGL